MQNGYFDNPILINVNQKFFKRRDDPGMNSERYLYQSEGMTKKQYFAFFTALAGWVFDYYEVFILTLLIIPISKELSLSAPQTAYIFSLQLLFLAIGGVISGFLADKFGRKPILQLTVVIYCIGTLARAFTFSYSWLLIWTAIAALGIGGEYGVGQTLVSEVVPKKSRGWWSGLLYGGIYIGIMIAALVGVFVVPYVNWRWIFGFSTLPIFVAVLIRKWAPESDVWEGKKANLVKTNNLNIKLFTKKAFLKPFFMCLIASILQFFAYYGVTTFLPTYLVKNAGFTLTKASWWVFFTAIAGLTGSLAGAYTMDRWGRRITLSYIAMSAALGGLLLFLTWQYLLTSSLILIPLFILYFGSNGATVFGALFSENFPVEVRSTGVSAALQIGRGLSFFPPIITAYLYPIYGYQIIVIIGAAEFFLLGLWAWAFKETKDIDINTSIIVQSSEAQPNNVRV